MQALQQVPGTECQILPHILEYVQYVWMDVLEYVRSVSLHTGGGRFYIPSLLARLLPEQQSSIR